MEISWEVRETFDEITKEDIVVGCTLISDAIYNILIATFSTKQEAVDYLKLNHPYSSISRTHGNTFQIKEYFVIKSIYSKDEFGKIRHFYDYGEDYGIVISEIAVFNSDGKLLKVFDNYVDALQFKEDYCYKEEAKVLEEENYIPKRAYVY